MPNEYATRREARAAWEGNGQPQGASPVAPQGPPAVPAQDPGGGYQPAPGYAPEYAPGDGPGDDPRRGGYDGHYDAAPQAAQGGRYGENAYGQNAYGQTYGESYDGGFDPGYDPNRDAGY